jgi:hypothetical protein
MDQTTRREPIRLNEINFTPILVAFGVVLLTLGKLIKILICYHFQKLFFAPIYYFSYIILDKEEESTKNRYFIGGLMRRWKNPHILVGTRWK